MASGFFALFDDIATLMDDVAVMSKSAAKKTAGILGDDLAVNANKASNFPPSRELPVLWAITKGSFINKLILLPIVFLLSAFASWLIVPILMLGGLYLAYEGIEKIWEWIDNSHHQEGSKDIDEKSKIRSAILTDFILSIEIVIIALGSVVDEPLKVQIPVVSFVAFLATIGVYGIVALIVRMDDMGYALVRISGDRGVGAYIGRALVMLLPRVIKALSIIGTIAMLLVAGGIYLHHIDTLHHLFSNLPSLLAELIIGTSLGIVTLLVVKGVKKLL